MKHLEKEFERVLQLLALLTAILLALMIAIICTDVFARNVLNSGVQGSVDLSEYALYLMTMFMAPYLLNRGQHIRIDFIVVSAPRSIAFVLELIVDILGTMSTAVLAWYGGKSALGSFSDSALIWRGLTIPEWWILAPMPICIALMSIEFVLRAIRLCTGARQPGGGPVATV
jgi:TRAP-type C4-dicarboxylate transport system permease small subunit